MTIRCSASQGLTLTEVLIASVIGIVGLLVVIQANQLRTGLFVAIRARGQGAGSDVLPAFSALQVMKDLEQADRVVIPNASTIQIRKPLMTTAGCAGVAPAPVCFDNPANYRWVQYRHVDTGAPVGNDALKFYDETSIGCANARVIANQLGLVQFSYSTYNAPGVPPPPPGGEPFASGADNNVVDFRVRWDGAVYGVVLSPTSRTYRAKVTLRNAIYGDLSANAATGDSGLGLAPLGVSPPPALCPP